MPKLIYLLLAAAAALAPVQGARETRPLFAPAPGSPFGASARISGVTLADCNGDGALDVVSPAGRDLTVLLGDGKGAFAPQPPVPIGMEMHMTAAGDFNRDGMIDLALGHHDGITVAVLLGNGKCGFSPAPRSPFAFRPGSKGHHHGLGLGDLDGDGNLDIATADQDDNSVSVLLGDGKAGFTAAPGSPFAVGRGPYPLALGDVNGDGKLDVVTPNTESHDLTILVGGGKGRLAPAPGSPLRVATRPYYVTTGDLNRDGKVDLVASHDDVNLISIALNDGTGRFKLTPASPVDLGARAWTVAIADVNGDQTADLVAATDRTVRVLLGDGRGGFSPAPGSPYPAGRGAWKLELGDLNRDGRLDVVANNVEATGIVVLLGR